MRAGAGEDCREFIDACRCDPKVAIILEGIVHEAIQIRVAIFIPPSRLLSCAGVPDIAA